MHDVFVVGVPLVVILAGMFMNNSRLDKMDGRLDKVDGRLDKMEARTESRFDRIESRLDRMQADLSQFYTITGKHEVRIEGLEKRT